MTLRSIRLRGRAFAIAAALGSVPLATAGALPRALPAPTDATAPSVSAADVEASNAKVRSAFGALVPMWRAEFDALGAPFAAPRLARFRGPGVRTTCGVIGGGNAAYCARDNTIYFDEIFVAVQAKRAGLQLGTDGDMAGVGVIAHEMGHAVAIQLGRISRFTYQNEAAADCLAGAFARRAQQDGSLEDGDIDEAFFGMAAAGDPTPRLTGDRRADRAILVRSALMGHGTEAQRTGNFRSGLEGGAGACLPEFEEN